MVSRRTLIAGLVAASAGFAATAFVYLRGANEARVDFERGYEGAFVRGFEVRERADGKYFRWTDDASAIELRNLPPDGTLAVEARLKTIRPQGEPLPSLSFTANGVTVHRARALPGLVDYSFEFPSTSRRLVLGIESETFDAGRGRKLGVQVLTLAVEASSAARPFLLPALFAAGAALLWFATGIVAGVGAPLSAVAATSLSLIVAHLTSLGPVRFSTYSRDVTLLALAILGFACVLRLLFDRIGWLHRSERSVAVGLLALLLLLKLGSWTYPLTLRSDADFQANRMAQLLRGNWYPTSVTQHEPPFRIPYPVALYVVAAPLAKLRLDLVPALELSTAVFDVLVSGLLLFVGWRFLDDFRAGALAAVLYQLVPMNGLSFSAGNFTNLFALSMVTLAFTLLLSAFDAGDRRAVLGFALATLLALTAHFGTLLEGIVLWPVWLVLFWLCPVPARDARKALTIAACGGFLVAGLYYLGYLDLITSQSERALEGGESSSRVLGLAYRVAFAREQLGLVFLAAAFLGSLGFLRRPLASGIHAALSGWFIATLLFLALDLLTALEIRYWLQALPLLALSSGLYLSKAYDRGRIGKLAALAAFVYTSLVGLGTLYESMVARYH
jgi:hypothetical protein